MQKKTEKTTKTTKNCKFRVREPITTKKLISAD